MEQLSAYLPEAGAGAGAGVRYCAVCLRTPDEAELLAHSDTDFFKAVQPLQHMSAWLCTWCSAELRSFRHLKQKAVRSQLLLSHIQSHLQQGNVKYLLEELAQIKKSKYCIVVIPEDNTIEPKTETPSQDVLESVGEVAAFCPEAEIDDSFEKIKIEVNTMKITDEEKHNDDNWNIEFCNDEGNELDNEPDCAFNSEPTKFVENSQIDTGQKASRRIKKVSQKPHRHKGKTKKYKLSSERAHMNTKEKFFQTRSSRELLSEFLEHIELTEKDLRKELAVSLQRPRYIQAPYKCGNCSTHFRNKDVYDKHMKHHSPSRGKYRCTICESYEPSKVLHRQHVRLHYRRYRCRVCGLTHYIKHRILAHYLSRHLETTMACLYCCKKFDGAEDSSVLEEHVRRAHHRKMNYKCDKCGMVFWVKNALNYHMKSHEHECPKCQQKFLSRGYLERHLVKIHENEKELFCGICKKQFKHKGILQGHNKRFHSDNGKKFQCDDCGKNFYNKVEVSMHIRWFHLKQGFQCQHCPKMFAKSHPLRQHVKFVHEKVPKVKDKLCDFCGRGFSSYNMLARHRLLHTGERPYVCSDCGKSFVQSSTLSVHYRTQHLKLKRNLKPRPTLTAEEKAQRKVLKKASKTEENRPMLTIEKRAPTKSGAKLNIQYHMNEAGVIFCPECNQTFKSKFGYSSHYRAHLRNTNTVAEEHPVGNLQEMVADGCGGPQM